MTLLLYCHLVRSRNILNDTSSLTEKASQQFTHQNSAPPASNLHLILSILNHRIINYCIYHDHFSVLTIERHALNLKISNIPTIPARPPLTNHLLSTTKALLRWYSPYLSTNSALSYQTVVLVIFWGASF